MRRSTELPERLMKATRFAILPIIVMALRALSFLESLKRPDSR